MKFGDAKIDPFISLEIASEPKQPREKESLVTKQPRVLNEFSAEMQRTMEHPRAELSCLLLLVQPERWMKGLWADVDGGWRDARTEKFFSFKQMREILDARITELGLSPELIQAWMHSSLADRGETVADEQAFYRLPFDQQMLRFKKA